MPTPPTTPAPDEKPSWWNERRLVTVLVVLVLVVAAGGYVGREYMIVRERRAWLDSHSQESPGKNGTIYEYKVGKQKKRPGAVRRWLGDEPFELINLVNPEPGDLQAVMDMFPEANIFVWLGSQ